MVEMEKKLLKIVIEVFAQNLRKYSFRFSLEVFPAGTMRVIFVAS
jgi:hypothetical protein